MFYLNENAVLKNQYYFRYFHFLFTFIVFISPVENCLIFERGKRRGLIKYELFNYLFFYGSIEIF